MRTRTALIYLVLFVLLAGYYYYFEVVRREARTEGLNPNRWFDNVELIAARRIGRETVTYVSNIYRYFLLYQMITARNTVTLERYRVDGHTHFRIEVQGSRIDIERADEQFPAINCRHLGVQRQCRIGFHGFEVRPQLIKFDSSLEQGLPVACINCMHAGVIRRGQRVTDNHDAHTLRDQGREEIHALLLRHEVR